MTIKIPLRAGFELPIAELPEPLLERLADEHSYKNPLLGRLKRMKKWTGHIPEKLTTFDADETTMVIPRGGADRLVAALEAFGVDYTFLDQRLDLPRMGFEYGRKAAPVVQRDYQEALIRAAILKETTVLRAPTGSGKCLGVGTLVLMFDGSTRRVEAVRPGDLLMGPDSKPRRVKSVSEGFGELFEIIPTKGAPWVCNEDHVLTLVGSETGKVVDIELSAYLKKSKWWRHCHKQFAPDGVDFEPINGALPVSPYFLGIWLGDGGKDLERNGVRITKPDPEILAAIKDEARRFGLRVETDDRNRCPTHRVVGKPNRGPNPLRMAIRRCVDTDFAIDRKYLCGSRDVRAELLAGLLDTDGHRSGANGFDFVQKRKPIAEAVVFLARSLGLRAIIHPKEVAGYGTFWRVSISGNTAILPLRIHRKKAKVRRQKKSVLRTGFKVSAIGKGAYFGFTLDGDGRFLLGDFTVTHNTEVGLEIIRRLDRPALVIVWTAGLLKQWVDRIKLRWGWRDNEIGIIGGGKRRHGHVVVALQQSLYRNPEQYAQDFAVVILDEASRAAAATFRNVVSAFPARYRIAISADERRKDNLEHLTWDMFGPVGHEVKKKELIDRGAICAVDVVLVKTGLKIDFLERAEASLRSEIVSTRYREIMDILETNEHRNAIAARIAGKEGRAGRATLVFCNRKTGEEDESGKATAGLAFHLAAAIATKEGVPCGLMLGGAENRKDFNDTKTRINAGELRCAVASSAAYLGEDMPRLESGVVVTPSAGNKQLFEQQVGRLRRTFPGKKKGTIYVLWDEHIFPGHKRNLESWYGRALVREEEW